MRNIQHLAYSLFIAVFLCAVPGLNALNALGVPLPGWLELGQEYSQLEGRKNQEMPRVSRSAITDGSFQLDAEKYLADLIPARRQALLLNASLERGIISIGNIPFGWSAYPTRFGSGYVEVPARHALLRTAMQPTQRDEEAVRRWVDNINETKRAFPDVVFVYELLNDPFSTPHNASWHLVSNPYANDWVKDNIIERLDPSIVLIEDPIQSEDELYDEWYTTEQHWKLPRALDSYDKLAKVLGWQPSERIGEELIEDRWYGAYARSGLDLRLSDAFYDMPTDFSMLTCTEGGAPVQRGVRSRMLAGESIDYPDPIFNYYHKYYGDPPKEVVYTNEQAKDGRVCLFVEQSYGVLLEPYVAQNYRTTICIDPLNASVDKSIAEYIEEYDVDDVVFQFAFARIEKGVKGSPKYYAQG